MVIGGIAIIAHGVRRFTTDIDVAVRGDAVELSALVSELSRAGIGPRIPDAVAFASAHLVLLMRHVPTGVDLDISLAWSAFEHDAIHDAELRDFGKVRVPMSTAADLVVFKAIAARPKDIEDAETLLLLHPRMNVARVRERVAALAALADEPELLVSFDATVARARPPPPGARRRSAKPTRR